MMRLDMLLPTPPGEPMRVATLAIPGGSLTVRDVECLRRWVDLYGEIVREDEADCERRMTCEEVDCPAEEG